MHLIHDFKLPATDKHCHNEMLLAFAKRLAINKLIQQGVEVIAISNVSAPWLLAHAICISAYYTQKNGGSQH